MGRITLLNLKAYYTGIVTTIKTVFNWQRDRHRSMEQNSEIDPHKYAQLIFIKGTKAIQCRKNSITFQTNGIKAIGHPQAKKILTLTNFTPYIKINTKCIIKIHVKYRTIKLWRGKNRRNSSGSMAGQRFDNKTRSIKEKLLH